MLNQTNKSDTISILEKYFPSSYVKPECDAIVFDGAAVLQMVSPKTPTNFKEYCSTKFLGYIETKSRGTRRADIVFDIYKFNSIKGFTRERRSFGSRIKVTENTRLPKKWREFFRVNDNKTEVFGIIVSVYNLYVQ